MQQFQNEDNTSSELTLITDWWATLEVFISVKHNKGLSALQTPWGKIEVRKQSELLQAPFFFR